MMKIGELAAATHTPVETIRFYEREGLLPRVARSANNYRSYGPVHQQRLTLIRHCRTLGMSLDEIRALLRVQDDPQMDCDAVNALLDEHIEHIATRIREWRALKKQLEALREQCSGGGPASSCGILNELAQAPTVPGASEVACPGLGRGATRQHA